MKALRLCFCIVAASMSPAVVSGVDLSLRYDAPAENWESQSLPIGNGRLGATFFGGIASERLAFNEISLWTGDEHAMGSYQAFGNVTLSLSGHDGDVTNYVRTLDLSEGVGRVSYCVGGVTYHREYFASHPAQVIVIRLTASQPGAYSGRVELADMHDAMIFGEGTTDVLGSMQLGATRLRKLSASGSLTQAMAQSGRRLGESPETMAYASEVMVVNEGGSLEGSLCFAFKECDALTVLVAAGTSYVLDYGKGFRGDPPGAAVTAQIEAAAAKPFEQLRDEHVRDYRSLFGRVELDLGQTLPAIRARATDDRLAAYAQGGSDPELEAMLFQYGRYLLMSCSRDTLPANLQGLWNDRNNPPWNSNYHTNINVQMNYWPAEPANLSECHTRLLDFVWELRQPWAKATATQFPPADGEPPRGWTVRTESNPFGNMGYVWNMGGSAWYAQHFWEHYAFTLDEAYLCDVAYPVMKEVCQFWEDHLKTLPDGRLVVPNGWSPEHGPRDVDGVTYDQMIVWDLLTNTIEAADVLGVDADYRDKVAEMRERLVGPQIGRWGQLKEWMDDIDDPNDQHRHTSHLFGVYPGRQISATKTPELATVAAVSLAARGSTGDSRRSWTWPWRCALWARLGEAEKAHEMVRGLLTYNVLPNLLANHPPMQMDGNFGITAAVCEMLLQSQAGEIHLLPALPAAWSSGSVKGLKARGAFEIDITWSGGKLVDGTIRSTGGRTCRIRYGEKVVDVAAPAGQSMSLRRVLDLW